MMIPYTKIGPTEHTVVTAEFDIVRLEVPVEANPPPILAMLLLTYRIGAIIHTAILLKARSW